MKKYIVFVLIFAGVSLWSQDISISGSVGFNFLYLDGVDDNLIADVETNSFISYYTSDLFSIVADIEGVGTLKVKYDEDEENKAPIELGVSQLYMNFFIEEFICYIGKKTKRVGSANWFNISNRITDKRAIGMVDFEIMALDFLNLGVVTYFNNSKNWENVSFAPNITLGLNRFNLELYLYYEELKSIFFTYNLSTQLGLFHIYMEGVIDEDKDFDFVLGSEYSANYFTVVAEYYYGEDNHHVGLSLSGRSQFIENFELNLSLLNSIPDSLDDFQEYYSLNGSISISYMYKDILFSTSFGKYFGGDRSEYILLESEDYSLGLFTTIFY